MARGEAGPGGEGSRWLHTVMGADGPDPRSRRVELEGGRARVIERLDEGGWVRYRLSGEGSRFRLAAVAGEEAPTAPVEPFALPPGLAALELDPPGEAARVGLRLRSGSAPLAAALPRAVLRRLVKGRELDPVPGSPIPGLAPLPASLGEVEAVMVMLRPGQSAAPWAGGGLPIPGEENPIVLARALGRWWEEEETMSDVAVAVGTAPDLSPGRWREAPRPGKKTVLLLPEGGFPPPFDGLEKPLESSWSGGPVVSSLPSSKLSDLVVLVSGEAPALLAARLREMARSPSMKGKLLAVYSLSGPVREDLPASLLAEGNLAGLGLAVAPPVGLPGVVEQVGALDGALAAGRRRKARIEKASGLFLWFY